MGGQNPHHESHESPTPSVNNGKLWKISRQENKGTEVTQQVFKKTKAVWGAREEQAFVAEGTTGTAEEVGSWLQEREGLHGSEEKLCAGGAS